MSAHRILFSGPGVLTGPVGTASRAECERTAPHMAREIKRSRGVRWISWKVVPAALPPNRRHEPTEEIT